MRLVTFQEGEIEQVGVVQGERVWAVRDLLPPEGEVPVTMIDLIAAGPTLLAQIAEGLAQAQPDLARPLDSVRLLAPIPRPRKNVMCVGMNYVAHAEESARSRGTAYVPLAYPAYFTKAPTTVNGPYDDIPYDGRISEQIDWEVELAVVIGPGGKDWTLDEALDHVFGYTVVNDVSARDIQNRHGGQFFRGKSLDGSCPMGPWIVTRDEIADPQALRLTTHVNGVLKQDSTTADMIFPIARVLAELSQGLTLEAGDILATGTPSGVGMGRTPQEWLHPGDVVEVTVEGIGTLRNRIAGAED